VRRSGRKDEKGERWGGGEKDQVRGGGLSSIPRGSCLPLSSVAWKDGERGRLHRSVRVLSVE
jgi:hypothetical protein